MTGFSGNITGCLAELDQKEMAVPRLISIHEGDKTYFLKTDQGYSGLLLQLQSLENSLSSSTQECIISTFKQMSEMRCPLIFQSFVNRGGELKFIRDYTNNSYCENKREIPSLLFGAMSPVQTPVEGFTSNIFVHELAHQFFPHDHSIHGNFFGDCLRADRDTNEKTIYPILKKVRDNRNYTKNYNPWIHIPYDRKSDVQYSLDKFCRAHGGKHRTDLYLLYEGERIEEQRLYSELFCIANEHQSSADKNRSQSPIIDAYLNVIVPLDAEISVTSASESERHIRREILKSALEKQHIKLFGQMPLPLEDLLERETITERDYHLCFPGKFKIESSEKEESMIFIPDTPGPCILAIDAYKKARHDVEYKKWCYGKNVSANEIQELERDALRQRESVEHSIVDAIKEVDQEVRRKLNLPPSRNTDAYLKSRPDVGRSV